MIRKTIAGLTIVAAALLANPFTHADAAEGRRGDVRECVNAARSARTQAQNKFRAAVVAARELEPAARQAAIQNAISAYRNSNQKANTDFVACIQAIDNTP